MSRIALEIDRNLEILLREYYEYDFINTANYEVHDISKEDITLLIMDDSDKNVGLRLKLLKKYNIKVLFLSSDFDPHPTTSDAVIATHKSALMNFFFIIFSFSLLYKCPKHFS